MDCTACQARESALDEGKSGGGAKADRTRRCLASILDHGRRRLLGRRGGGGSHVSSSTDDGRILGLGRHRIVAGSSHRRRVVSDRLSPRLRALVAVAKDGEGEEEGEEEGEVDPSQPRKRLSRLARARDGARPAPPDPAEPAREGAGAADEEAPEDEDEDQLDEDRREDVRRVAAVEEEVAVRAREARDGQLSSKRARARENSQDGKGEEEDDGCGDELGSGGVVPLKGGLELGGVGAGEDEGEEGGSRCDCYEEGVDERPG